MLDFAIIVVSMTVAMFLLYVLYFLNGIRREEGQKEKTYSLITKINNIQLSNDKTVKQTKYKLNNKVKATIVLLIVVTSLVSPLFYKHEQQHTIDINTCTYEELTDLYGIGEVRANLIINNRPYTDKEQLFDLLGKQLYNSIKEELTVKEGS